LILTEGDCGITVCPANIYQSTKTRVTFVIKIGVRNIVQEDQVLALLNATECALGVGVRRIAQKLDQVRTHVMRRNRCECRTLERWLRSNEVLRCE